MATVTISEAKAKLSALVEAAERGEDVLILRGAKPAVTLTPVTEADLAIWPQVPKGALADFDREIEADRAAGELEARRQDHRRRGKEAPALSPDGPAHPYCKTVPVHMEGASSRTSGSGN